MLDPEALSDSAESPRPPAKVTDGAPSTVDPSPTDLPPRLSQTLTLLLQGDSEKQVAIKLKLSRHTIHGYVKALYRRYEVQTRAELLARHFQR